MEATAGHSGSLPVPSSHPSQRKEWRAISEHSFRNNGSDESEHHKLGQTDERTIYEVQEGTGPVNFDLCSINIDGEGFKEDILQLRIQEISRQREELQHMEIELRTQTRARTEIMKMHNHYRSQLKEHADAFEKLKEQLQEREQEVNELKLNLEAKNRELHAFKIDTEAVWAKEDLFREQNKELATFKRDRDISEAERSQHLKNIHDLQEHIKEKESQFLVLEEQHRAAQEKIIYKDEQLRKMQAWMAHVQEADVLQSTNQSLQAELRQRTEQFNQYWIALQRQFVEMEHHHLQTIQQLHLELSEIRGRSGLYQGNSQIVRESQTDPSLYLQNNGNQVNANDGTVSNSSFTFGSDGKFPASSSSTQMEHVPVVSTVPGMGGFLPTSQMTALHPFVIHQPVVPESLPSTNPVILQTHAGHLESMSAMPVQHWQNQQEVQGNSLASSQEEYHMSQLEQNLLRFHSHYSHERPSSENVLHPEYLSSHINQQHSPSVAISVSNEQGKVLESNDKNNQASQETLGTSNATSSLNSLLFEPTAQKNEQVQDQNMESAINESQQPSNSTQQWSASNLSASASPRHRVDANIAEESNNAKLVFSDASVPAIGASITFPASKTVDPLLLDERALLACIVRAIPAGSDGRIRISTTLPNRLGKMLAPLHWHDYKKHYGKLDDFVASHPELFVVEGDYIHLCEGAQETISATAAAAKVAAAAASYATYSSMFPSVAVTPISQSNRHKKAFSNDSKRVGSASFMKDAPVNNTGNSSDKFSEVPVIRTHQINGLSVNIVQGLADMAISSSTSSSEKNVSASNTPPDQLNLNHLMGNGSSKTLTYGRIAVGGKKQGRASESARFVSRR